MRPRFAINFPPSRNRGRREDRVLAAPAVSRAICVRQNCTRAYRAAGAFRPSLRNGFTAYFVLLRPQNLAECANGRFSQNRPSLDLSPIVLEGRRACREAWDRSGVLPQPEQLQGLRARTEQGRELDDGTK